MVTCGGVAELKDNHYQTMGGSDIKEVIGGCEDVGAVVVEIEKSNPHANDFNSVYM